MLDQYWALLYIKKSLPCLASVSVCSLGSAGIDLFEWKGSPFLWLPHSFWRRALVAAERNPDFASAFAYGLFLVLVGFKWLVLVRSLSWSFSILRLTHVRGSCKSLLCKKFITVWHGKVFLNAFEILISKLLKYHFPSTNFWEFEELLYMNSLMYNRIGPDYFKSSTDFQSLRQFTFSANLTSRHSIWKLVLLELLFRTILYSVKQLSRNLILFSECDDQAASK